MDRIPTGVVGLDEQIEGGIPERAIVIVAGTPGTMKSSFVFSIVRKNAELGKKCMYMSIEQSEKSLLRQMKNLGFSMEGLEPNLTIIDLSEIRMEMIKAEIDEDRENWWNVIKNLIKDSKEITGLDVFAMDSLTSFEMLFERKLSRKEIFEFFQFMRKLGITSFLISEMEDDEGEYCSHDEDFVADGIIHLKFAEVSDVDVQRRLRCVKLRGTKHTSSYFNLLVERGKFAVTKTIGE